MHLLFISSLLPDANPSTGYEIANATLIEAYRRRGVKLTFVGYKRAGAPTPEGAICLGEITLENASASGRQKAAWVASALRKRLPISAAKVALLTDTELRNRLREAGKFDGVIVNSVQMPTAYPFLLRDYKAIFVSHNVEHRSAAENAENATGVVDRVLFKREAALLEQAEISICAAAKVVHTLSEADRTGLGLDDDPRAITLPLIVGRPHVADDGIRSHDVGLIGTWSWAPNRVGLDWFLRDVVPLLPQDIDIAIAGRIDGTPPPDTETVRFVGRVEDAQAFVRGSRVLALATKGGTGVQLKTLEAFEEGLPAVATTRALRGVTVLPENVRLANAADDFAERLIELVRGERTGTIQRLDGRAFVRNQTAGLDAAIDKGLALAFGLRRQGVVTNLAGRERPRPVLIEVA